MILTLVHLFSHYLFASDTAHVAAMYAAFLAAAVATGAPPVLAAPVLGFISSLYGGLTHYASGLTLNSILDRVSDRLQVAERVQRVVDDLDDTVKTVRGPIYALRERDRSDGRGGLRAKLLAETDQAAAVLGFGPALRMTGLPDTEVPSDYAEHLVAVLRETLSNATRHAHATAVEVTAAPDDTQLRLRVAGNGTGIDLAVTRRSGLDNLRRRATDLGGSFTLTPNRPTGTIAEWTVPLPAQTQA